MRATSVVGRCASDLQYRVGSISQFTVRLTQTGSTVTGTVALDTGTCDVTGSVLRNTLTMTTTACRPPERTIYFFVCEGNNAELVIRSLAIESSANGAVLTGKYTYIDDIRSPVEGPVIGVLTESGDATTTRR